MTKYITEASQLVRTHALYAGGMGLIPVPLADMAGIAGVQIKMIKDLCTLYGIEFKKERAKTVVLSLMGGVAAGTLASGLPGSLIKAIPGIGSFIGFLSMPTLAAAVTYGVGNALIMHLELGGTLTNLDPGSVQAQAAYAAGAKTRTTPAEPSV